MLTVVIYTDAPHTCATCAFDTGDGIFYHDASGGRYADPRRRSQIYVRIWFSSAHIFSRNNRLKEVSSRQSLEDYLDVRTRRRRGDRLKPSLLVKPVHPTRDSG